MKEARSNNISVRRHLTEKIFVINGLITVNISDSTKLIKYDYYDNLAMLIELSANDVNVYIIFQ